MEKLGLLLTLVALLHLKTSLAGGVAQGDIGTSGVLFIFSRKVHVWGSFGLKFSLIQAVPDQVNALVNSGWRHPRWAASVMRTVPEGTNAASLNAGPLASPLFSVGAAFIFSLFLAVKPFESVHDCVSTSLPTAVCPWNNWGMGMCAELCHADSDCQDPILSKCCSNGCGHQCTAPYIGQSRGQNPQPLGATRIITFVLVSNSESRSLRPPQGRLHMRRVLHS